LPAAGVPAVDVEPAGRVIARAHLPCEWYQAPLPVEASMMMTSPG
jgi:hypothetical protein